MKPNRNPARLIGSSLALGIAISLTLYKSEREIKTPQDDDLREAERIFEAREKVANLRIGGPLGTLIMRNQLEPLKSGLNPGLLDDDWFQTIRALFISGKIQSLRAEVQEFLLEESLARFERSLQRPDADLILYRTQIERLPPPLPGSPSRKTLRNWALNPQTSPTMKWSAFFKLLAQDAAPDPDLIEAFSRLIQCSNPSSEALALLDEIRSPSVRKSLLGLVLKKIRTYPGATKADLAKVLSRNAGLIPDDYKKVRSLSASLIKSGSPIEVESGLKSMANLLDFKPLDPDEVRKLRAWIKEIPASAMTPPVNAGIDRILVKIGGETN
ncbi:MAG: hypothetical protein KGP28_11610 [Bdellovibrionales bacterium]|nr:hypothetical protein [Bdellovibrionales bacterium]